MRNLLLAFLILLAACTVGSAQTGDIAFWVPSTNVSSQDAQITLNEQYASVQVTFSFVYFKTGFFNKLNTLILTTGASHNFTSPGLTSQQVSKVMAKNSGDGQSLGTLRESITAVIPITGNKMTLQASIRGTGEDRFKKLFDIISGSDVKTALDLTDATVAKVGAVTSIVKNLMANPYTSDKPADILQFSSDFEFFPNRLVDRPTALREGYIVIVSSRASDGTAFEQIRNLVPADMNQTKNVFEVRQSGLFFKASGKAVEKVSYVILNVSQSREIGEATNSAWYKKYNQAVARVKNNLDNATLPQAYKEAIALWDQGTALLAEDKAYLDAERRTYASFYKDAVDDAVRDKGVVGINFLKTNPTGKLLSRTLMLPEDFSAIAENFKKSKADLTGELTVVLGTRMSNGGTVSLTSKRDPNITFTKTMAAGASEIIFDNLLAGEYLVEIKQDGAPTLLDSAVVNPRQKLRIESGNPEAVQ